MGMSFESIRKRWQNTRAMRHVQFALRRLFDEIWLPVMALKKGHLYLIGYTVGLSTLTAWGTLELSRQWYSLLLQTQPQTGLTLLNIGRIWFFSSILLWILSLPFFCTAVALPLRILWTRGNLRTTELLSKTFTSLRFSQRAVGLALRVELRNLLPLAAMILIYFAFVGNQKSPIVMQLYTLGLMGVALGTIWKSLPLVLSPLLAIVGQFDGRDAIRYCSQVFRPKALEFLAIIVALTGIFFAIFLKFHSPSAPVKGLYGLEIALYSLFGWYGVALLSFKTMQAVAAAQNSPNTAQNTQSNQTAQHAAGADQQRPVIHIENLWVSQDDAGGFKIKNPQ